MLLTDDREDGASAALARVDALHRGLTQIVLEGGNLDGIAAEVARVLDVGVLFTSTDGRERAAAPTWAGWSACAREARSRPTTSTRWSVPRRSRRSWSPATRRSRPSRASTRATSCATSS